MKLTSLVLALIFLASTNAWASSSRATEADSLVSSDHTKTFSLPSASGTLMKTTDNTSGSAASWTTARNLAGNSVDGTANVNFSNKFIVQGTTDAGLSGAQFLGSLSTGILKNTTTTGVLGIASSGDFPTLNQNTTGTALNVTGTVANNHGGTGADSSASSGIPHVSSGTWTFSSVVDADVSSSAAIAFSKLAHGSANALPLFDAGGIFNNASLNPGSAGRFVRDSGTAWAASTIQVGDVPTLNQNTSGTAANLSGTPALPNGTTATTQSQADNSTKLATTSYVDTGLATKLSGSFAQEILGACNGSTTAFTAAHTPVSAGSFHVLLDGVMLVQGSGFDYTFSGSTVTLAAACATGQILYADYTF